MTVEKFQVSINVFYIKNCLNLIVSVWPEYNAVIVNGISFV